MAKNGISWKRTVDGRKVEIETDRQGDQWLFFCRKRRNDQRERIEDPPLEEWLELLDAVERRVVRGLMRPHELVHLKKIILSRFPGTRLPSGEYG